MEGLDDDGSLTMRLDEETELSGIKEVDNQIGNIRERIEKLMSGNGLNV